MINGFIGLIKNKKVCPHVEDRMVWTKAIDGFFSIRSLFDVLEGRGGGGVGDLKCGRGLEPAYLRPFNDWKI